MSRRDTVRQVASFAAIGAVSTTAYVVLFAVLRTAMAAAAANAVAQVVTAVANTAANRRWTFGVRSAEHRGRDHAAGLVAFGTALAVTTATLAALQACAPRAGRTAEAVALLAANAAATLVRFVLLRAVVSGGSARPAVPQPPSSWTDRSAAAT